jgi:hypothetical protein
MPASRRTIKPWPCSSTPCERLAARSSMRTGRQADDGAQVGLVLDQLAEHECVSFTRYRLEEVRKGKLGHLLADHMRVLISRPGVNAAPDTGIPHLLGHL